MQFSDDKGNNINVLIAVAGNEAGMFYREPKDKAEIFAIQTAFNNQKPTVKWPRDVMVYEHDLESWVEKYAKNL